MRSRRGAVVAVVAVLVALGLGAGSLVLARAGPDDPVDAADAPTRTPTATATGRVDSNGCPVTDLSDRPFRSGAETGPIAGVAPQAGRLCAYDGGQLVGSHRLSTGEAGDLADAVRGGPDGIGPEGLGCPRDAYDYLDGPLEPHFTAQLTYADEAPTDLWVYGNVCTPSGVVNNVGRFLRVTPRLSHVLGHLARTPEPFPVTDPSLPPGPVPSGPMTDADCPDGITHGRPGAHETARAAILRLAGPVFATYPDARQRQAGMLGGEDETSLVRADGSRVGRFVTEHLPGHRWWSVTVAELC